MKNYVVIGASSGIGEKLAHMLAESGHRVFATYNTKEKSSTANNMSYHQLDVLEEEPILDFLPESIDGLAYCPGSIQLRPFKRLKASDFARDYELQLIGAVKLIQSLLPRLQKAEAASIVLFSTVAVQSGFNFHSLVASSKGAVEGLTRSLAAEFAPRIRVNCIAPSLTDTPLAEALLNTDSKREANAERHPLKRIGTTDDIASMAAFLISEKSGWISGQVMAVDGGMSVLKV
jgi:NAD(P)-dependent dehydrogenase (short-subunit alcohol dehydrogenase family)